MEDRIIKFVSALRGGGVRISLAESADAFMAVEQLGVLDREMFRLSLRATLIKDASDIALFEELFSLFFDAIKAPPLMNPSEDLTPEEAYMVAEALREFSNRLRRMLERLLRGERLSREELDQLGQLVGLNRAADLRERDWMAQRMARALRFREVQDALQQLQELLAQMGMNKQRLERLRQILQANQQAMMEQLRQHAGQQIAETMSHPPRTPGTPPGQAARDLQRPDESLEALLNRPFAGLSDRDLDRLRREVRRLAALLRSRVALRQRRAKTGQLDAKATIRANLKHGGVPIEIRHRDRRLKPKLVVICDISTSMRPCSELMLSLIYAMQDQISKTHAFAFIDRLEYISPDFAGREINQAVAQVLERMPSGHYNTDLGCSLEDFAHGYMDTVDSHTTFIVVGDARNNYNDPRLDLFGVIARRSHRTMWLNPEPPVLWGTGDSDMLTYASMCDDILEVSTVAELTAAIDRLLISR